jgi:hypothetical protein
MLRTLSFWSKTIAVFGCLLVVTSSVQAETLAEIVRGRILLDVENNGEGWYVYPPSDERYYLGRPDDAFAIMRTLSLGISDVDLARIPAASDVATGDLALRQRLAGYILLQVEQHGEAWYVDPLTLRRSFLGRPSEAFAIMTNFGLGISSANLAQIPIASTSLELPPESTYTSRSFTFTNERGSFPLDVITLRRDAYRMITDVAETSECDDDCAAQSLSAYVNEHNAFAGMHGTYFCPPDYVSCQQQSNTFLPPVYDTASGDMFNDFSLRLHDRPLIAEDRDGELYYFHRTDEFGSSVNDFEDTFDTTLQAAIGNWPSLVENGTVIVDSEPQEPSFALKATRGAIGWDDDVIYLVVASSATVTDMAYILQGLGAEYAMNLDGGGSASLYVNGSYLAGPGRLLPNAIVFEER